LELQVSIRRRQTEKNRPIAVDSRRNRAKSKLAKFSFEIKSAIF
jgi:hypothetical protein